MNKIQKIFLASLGGLLLIGIGIPLISKSGNSGYSDNSGGQLNKPVESPLEAPKNTDTQKPRTYSMTDVAKHNIESSCWSAVDGGVYDLSDWIAKHPGGERAILGMCGIDATEAFRRMHDHNPKQENILANFLIGALAK